MLKTTQARKVRTGTPDKYPQGKFKDKSCRCCQNLFSPQAPSQLYCSTDCASKAQQDAYYARTYGISREEWEAMYARQGGRCFICLGEGFTMKADHEAKLMVDHCHSTGKVRGLLCHNCNRALGLLQDDKQAIKRALEYLEGATTIR